MNWQERRKVEYDLYLRLISEIEEVARSSWEYNLLPSEKRLRYLLQFIRHKAQCHSPVAPYKDIHEARNTELLKTKQAKAWQSLFETTQVH